ncbi:unnamed protein product [Adineta ricciae]|uniref:Uncharacterized protein n=1 Tax=Adineta ricciae TaxID=249248 RepID=A0A815Q1E1_ADIRI|nr:unnamed protein product [Adineta ricciae]CAF1456926.1 unnamed protein product [Adineta ricciae]
MSILTLESLPNEILVKLFEKYIDGTDIIHAFAGQQNQRIDDIVAICQRLCFNFQSCRKDDFQVWIGLVPNYVTKIHELILSDYNSFGQVCAFLTAFPTFQQFTELHKLYIHFHGCAVDWSVIQTALLSLTNTPLETLILKKYDRERMPFSLHVPDDDDGVRLSRLKQLYFAGNFTCRQWNFIQVLSPNLEYLTNLNINVEFSYLQRIFRQYPRLKYLNVRFVSKSYDAVVYNGYSSEVEVRPLSTLHTFILSFPQDHVTVFEDLSRYLDLMPALSYLDIKAHRALLNATQWRSFLHTALFSLTHFHLKTLYRHIHNELDRLLDAFETPFWIDMTNFYFIITEHQHFDSDSFRRGKSSDGDEDEFDYPVTRWWIVPFRGLHDDIPVNDITSFGIPHRMHSLSPYYQFTKVQSLTICRLDESVLAWLQTHLNLSGIKHLDLSNIPDTSDTLNSLVSNIQDIVSLRVSRDQLRGNWHLIIDQMKSLKALYISSRYESDVCDRDVQLIAQLFPTIEHLAIRTIASGNVSIARIRIPSIRFISIESADSEGLPDWTNISNLFYRDLITYDRFTSRRSLKTITTWIDSTMQSDQSSARNRLQN